MRQMPPVDAIMASYCLLWPRTAYYGLVLPIMASYCLLWPLALPAYTAASVSIREGSKSDMASVAHKTLLGGSYTLHPKP